MGWTYGWRTPTVLRDHIREQLGGLIPQPRTQADAVVSGLAGDRERRGVLKDALVNRCHHYYAAFQPGDGTVTVIVCMFHGNSRSEDGWGYKDMDEACGPVIYDCPLSILDLATDPAPNEYAKEWRQNVRDYWARRRRSLAFAKAIGPGDKVWIAGLSGTCPYTVTHLRPLYGYNTKGNIYRIPTTRIERVESATAPRRETLHSVQPSQ